MSCDIYYGVLHAAEKFHAAGFAMPNPEAAASPLTWTSQILQAIERICSLIGGAFQSAVQIVKKMWLIMWRWYRRLKEPRKLLMVRSVSVLRLRAKSKHGQTRTLWKGLHPFLSAKRNHKRARIAQRKMGHEQR